MRPFIKRCAANGSSVSRNSLTPGLPVLWDKVQAELDRRNRHGVLGIGHGNRYLFSGKVKCGECGATFVPRKKKYKNGTVSKKWSCFTAVNEGHRHTDPMGNRVGCNIGLLLRDDFATRMLQDASGAAMTARRWLTEQVTACTLDVIERSKVTNGDSSEKLEHELQQIKLKKEAILDAFFSRDITKEEMRLMNERYDAQTEQLRTSLLAAREREQLSYETSMLKGDVRAHIAELAGKGEDEVFYRNLLDGLTVYADRRVEVRLNLLPRKWRFVLDSLDDIRRRLAPTGFYFNPAVPTKGSKWNPERRLPIHVKLVI